MSWLKRIFTGANFWLFNFVVNFFLTILGVFIGADATMPIIVMWISLATYEILKRLEAKKEESDAV